MNPYVSCRELRSTTLIAAIAAVLAATAVGDGRAAEVNDNARIFLYDPIVNALVSVAESSLKVGCVYYHYSPRLQRRVWAVRGADGQFSNACGEGSLQPGPAFDIRYSTEVKEARLAAVDKDLLKQIQEEGGTVFFRLNKNDRWELDRGATHAVFYDAETKRLWEFANGQYNPVTSAPFCYQWQPMGKWFVPLGHESASVFGGTPCVSQPPGRLDVPGCPCAIRGGG